MKIAMFTNNYLPNPYGVSTSIEGFRLALEKSGHTVYVFAPQWGKTQKYENAHVFRYPAIKVPTKVDFSLVIPHSTRIEGILRDLQIDIVHAHHPNLLGAVAQRWARKKGVPLIFTWHSLYDRYAHYAPIVPDHIVGKWAMHNAASFADVSDHVIVPTRSIISVMRDAGVRHDRISVVPSGVDEDLFAQRRGIMIREKFGLAEKDLVLVTISRLTEEKNVVFLMRNVARVMQKNQRIKFLCCGEGDQMAEMRSICDRFGVCDRVFFPGKIERDMVKHYLDAGDIFVYASTSETQGTIVTENMFCGKPILALGKNGVGDLLQHEITGIVTEEDDLLFSDGLQRLIADEKLRDKMGRNAYDIARTHFSATVCAERLLQVYDDVIADHSR